MEVLICVGLFLVDCGVDCSLIVSADSHSQES